MGGGHVLDLSIRRLSEFFQEELGVDIYEPRWAVNGSSKAKRLRTYLRQADRETALRTLQELWDYRETSGLFVDHPVLGEDGRTAFFRIIKRLGGTPPASTTPDTDHAPQCLEPDLANELAARLITISGMDPQRKRVRVREVPQTRLRRLRFGRARFVPSARRADRRQPLVGSGDLPARSEVDECPGRRGDAPFIQRQGRRQGEVVTRAHGESKRFHSPWPPRVGSGKERRLHGRT